MVRVALTSRAPKTDSGNTPTFGARPSISLIIESAIPFFKIGPKCPARLNGRLGLLWHIAAIHACDREIVAFVKGFGCRPHTAMPRTPAAGVRKPPREETAIGEGGAVPRGRYGDLSATAVGANGA